MYKATVIDLLASGLAWSVVDPVVVGGPGGGAAVAPTVRLSSAALLAENQGNM